MAKQLEEKFGFDSEARTQALKTATYAVMHLVVAMAVAYALSGSWKIALGIGLIEPAVQTVAYTLHERVWKRAAARRGQLDEGSQGEAPRPLPADLSGDIRPATG
ncbi:DUF2061 domain-containing protein [Marivibrio halodurans]|uniref:DUF2061 domain-containing protein n=2 Tax=Marivibrio halodurans TaxID=2039722 RepID=A0A8J7S5S1_9PROT|nr:DUF2061 domain-containing protein [Marivibrio halodurans]